MGNLGYTRRAFLAVLLASLVIIAAGLLYYSFKDDFTAPEKLYQQAQKNNPDRAARLYQLISEKLPLIQEYAWLWQAQLQLSDPDRQENLNKIIAFYPHSPAAYKAYTEMARLLAKTEPQSALAAYHAALALNDELALRLEMVHFLEKQGLQEDAYSEYKVMLSDKPDAFVDMRRTALNPLTLAADLKEAAYFSDALEILETGHDTDTGLLKAQALFGLERFEEAEQAYQKWLQDHPDEYEAKLGLAKVYALTGRTPRAIELYQEIDSSDSDLELAKLLEDDDPETAVVSYLDSPYPVAWWNATWLLEENKQLEETLDVYRRIAQAGVYFSDDAAYRMYILAQRLQDDEAADEAAALLDEMQPNWLAMRANQEPQYHPPESSITAAGEEILAKVNILDTFERRDLAYLELLFGAKYSEIPEIKLRFLEELANRGYMLPAQEIAQAYINEHPDAPRDFWRLSYPQPYVDSVNQASEAYAIDPLLIWAVMRVESNYKPDALSLAGARGLLQLMPSTQEWAAGELKEETQPGDAFVPEKNIALGVWFLDNMLDYFGGDLELAILAFNAGAASVEQWQEDPMVTNREDLIRWAWYGETREYLQRVLLAYRIYQELYG